MKILLAILWILITNAISPPKFNELALDIYDYNASMSYTLHYHIIGNKLIVVKLSGLQGEPSKVLFRKTLAKQAVNQLSHFLNSAPTKHLKATYKNPLTQDGDQKRFVWVTSGTKKVVDFSNVYNSQLAKLITIVNKYLTDNIKMSYPNK